MSGVDDYGSQEIRNSMQKELEAQRAEQNALLSQYQADDSSGFRAQQNGGGSGAAQGGIDPGTAMQFAGKFYGGGGAPASQGVGAAPASTSAAPASSSSASSGISAVASNPYAWIAAAIIANETWQTKTGNRRNGLDGWKDRVSGAVLRQDSDRYAKHLFKDDMSGDKTGIGGDMNLGADFGSPMTLKKIPKDLKNTSIAKLVKKIF